MMNPCKGTIGDIALACAFDLTTSQMVLWTIGGIKSNRDVPHAKPRPTANNLEARHH
jgi:hypothetical protein